MWRGNPEGSWTGVGESYSEPMAHTDSDLDVGLAQNLDGGLGDYTKAEG
jgi:hypothetical protein